MKGRQFTSSKASSHFQTTRDGATSMVGERIGYATGSQYCSHDDAERMWREGRTLAGAPVYEAAPSSQGMVNSNCTGNVMARPDHLNMGRETFSSSIGASRMGPSARFGAHKYAREAPLRDGFYVDSHQVDHGAAAAYDSRYDADVGTDGTRTLQSIMMMPQEFRDTVTDAHNYFPLEVHHVSRSLYGLTPDFDKYAKQPP